MNKEFAEALEKAQTSLGDNASKLKAVFDAVKNAKAKVDGKNITMKLNVTTDAVMKALKD